MAAAMEATTEALRNQMNNENGNNGEEGPMTLATFLKVHPMTFRGTTNPTEADNWLQAMEWALQAQQVPGEQWVEFATCQLQGEAQYWWQGTWRILQPDGAGQISIAEYTNKFEELCRFFGIYQGAPEDFAE
ncbi:uncharacterized protein LOC107607813 [Arachis ipaensis]|uniref:uncharacterized protein LOC107607813 n=1 Tax=Arachis ipaensis TaxID=130454 RepID=UPI0007AF82D9|nr:uncharacterized protein LOC107607813 [Arachis ipaensis]